MSRRINILGSYTSGGIVQRGLIQHLDAGNTSSYPGTGTTWFDLTSNNYDAIMTNGLSYNPSNGGVMVGDGVNDYADIDSAEPGTRFQATDDFSLCAWFNKDTISAVGQLIGRNDVNQGNFFLRIQNSKLRAQVQDTSTSPTHTARVESSVLSSATWYFGTLVYTGSTKTLELYINAVSHGTDNEPLLSGNLYSQNMLSVFKRNQGTGDVFFGGKIPITMIYNVALTPAEIQQNFNEDKARYGL